MKSARRALAEKQGKLTSAAKQRLAGITGAGTMNYSTKAAEEQHGGGAKAAAPEASADANANANVAVVAHLKDACGLDTAAAAELARALAAVGARDVAAVRRVCAAAAAGSAAGGGMAAAPAPTAAPAVHAFGSVPPQHRTLLRMFQHYDADGSGAIDANELEAVLADLTIPASKRTLSFFDTDGDGVVSFAEFVAALESIAATDNGGFVPSAVPPVQLVAVDEQRRFALTEDGRAALESLASDLVVVGIVGQYRSGKSYLLNRLFGSQTGFALGSTTEGKTRGIWLWRSAVRADGKCLVLLDTEGLFDTKNADEEYDAKIFALTVLLSSVMMVNVLNVIDSKTLAQLSFVSSLVDMLVFDDGTPPPGAGDDATLHAADEFSRFFPRLQIVVRDFALRAEKDGKQLSGNEYLESALTGEIEGRGRSAENARRARDFLMRAFPKHRRSLFPLVRPVHHERELQTLENMPWEHVRPEFTTAVAELQRQVLGAAEVKSVVSLDSETGEHRICPVDGASLAALAASYIDALNRGVPANVMSAWGSLEKVKCERGSAAAMECYKEKMYQFEFQYPLSESDFGYTHGVARGEALAVFDGAASGAAAYIEYRRDLLNTLGGAGDDDEAIAFRSGLVAEFWQKNEKKSQIVCEELVSEEVDAFEALECESAAEVTEKARHVTQRLKSAAVGPARSNALLAASKLLNTAKKSKLAALKADEVERKMQEEATRVANEIEEQRMRMEKMRERELALEHEQELMQREMDKLQAAAKAEAARRAEALAEMEQSSQAQVRAAVEAGKQDAVKAMQARMEKMRTEFKRQEEAAAQRTEAVMTQYGAQMAAAAKRSKELEELVQRYAAALQEQQQASRYEPELVYYASYGGGGRCGAPTTRGGSCKFNRPCHHHG